MADIENKGSDNSSTENELGPPDDDSIQAAFTEFISNTTAHGISRVGTEQSKIRKIIWVLIFSLAMGYFIYQFTNILNIYFSYPIAVKTEVLHRTEVEFPSVTVCNINKLKSSTLRETNYWELVLIDEFNSQELQKLGNVFKRRKKRSLENNHGYNLEHDTLIGADGNIVQEKLESGLQFREDFKQVLPDRVHPEHLPNLDNLYTQPYDIRLHKFLNERSKRSLRCINRLPRGNQHNRERRETSGSGEEEPGSNSADLTNAPGSGGADITNAPASNGADVTNAPGSSGADVTNAPGSGGADVTNAPASDGADVTNAPGSSGADVTNAPGSGGADITNAPGSGGADVTNAPGSGGADITNAPGSGGADVTNAPGSGGADVTNAPGSGGADVANAPGSGGADVANAPGSGGADITYDSGSEDATYDDATSDPDYSGADGTNEPYDPDNSGADGTNEPYDPNSGDPNYENERNDPVPDEGKPFEFQDNGFLTGIKNDFDFKGFLKKSSTSDLSDLSVVYNPTMTELDRHGHQAYEFVIQCSFDNQKCSHRDFKKRYNSKYGLCYTFNPGENKTIVTSKLGSRYGLRLTLNVQADEYIGMFSHSIGARISVHPHNVSAFPEDNGIDAPPGMKTSVGLRLNRMIRQKEPYSTNCSDGTDVASYYPGVYSVINCGMSCLQKKLKKTCDCVDALINDDTYPPCSPTNRTQEYCRQRVHHLYDTNSLGCDCRPACHELKYEAQVSSNEWPSPMYSALMLQRYNDSFAGTDFDKQYATLGIRENMVRTHIYFEDFEVISINEYAEYPWEKLCADIGGLTGLFMGVSICTALEFAEFLMDISIILANKCRSQKKSSKVKVAQAWGPK